MTGDTKTIRLLFGKLLAGEQLSHQDKVKLFAAVERVIKTAETKDPITKPYNGAEELAHRLDVWLKIGALDKGERELLEQTLDALKLAANQHFIKYHRVTL